MSKLTTDMRQMIKYLINFDFVSIRQNILQIESRFVCP
jgi:hypothetical protein